MDNFYISSINDSSMNGRPSYVFKTSRKMARMVINMDQNYPHKNPSQDEPAYFDGMYKRCSGWKTLTLWVYHNASTKLLRLATMEVKGETSENVALFWRLFNEVLAEVKGEPGYQFNPCDSITDEAGANFNGVGMIYGEEALQKSYSCRFHYTQCLNNLLNKIPSDLGELRSEVDTLGREWCRASTLSEYNEIKSRLDCISGVLSCISNWVNWWHARFHLFPVFRGFSLSSLNLAEIGHSTLKRNRPLFLVDAAWEDVCSMIIQEEEFTKFLEGRGKSMGRGPSTASQAARDKRAQCKRAKEYVQSFKENNFTIGDGEDCFIPTKKAKHKAPNTFSSSNPLQAAFPSKCPGSVNAAFPSCFPGTSDASPPSSCVGSSCPTTLSVLQGNTPLPPPSPYAPRPTTDSLLHADNPPMLCFLQGLISKCYGCGNKFTDEIKIPPRDLICKFKKKRERLICGQWVPGWKMAWCYFHLNINCLQLGRSTIEACDVYIPSVIMAQLTDIHTKYLIKSGWWHCMKKNY